MSTKQAKILYKGPTVSVSEARKTGIKRYFTGRPCKYGHVDQRLTVNCTCVRCDLNGRAAYHARNKDKDNSRVKDWHERNPDKVAVYRKKWAQNNQEKIAETSRIYIQNNPDKVRQWNDTRRARKANAEGYYSDSDVEQILIMQHKRCAAPWCKKDISSYYEVDHIVALSIGGSNWPDNLQMLCMRCNRSKSNKTVDQWYLENKS